jgi:hypothetical protein
LHFFKLTCDNKLPVTEEIALSGAFFKGNRLCDVKKKKTPSQVSYLQVAGLGFHQSHLLLSGGRFVALEAFARFLVLSSSGYESIKDVFAVMKPRVYRRELPLTSSFPS